jgi:uncharacterized protein (UPF0332 family)
MPSLTPLRSKSEMNLASASLLHKNDYYAPAVHCAYYGMLQLIKHILIHKYGISQDQLATSIQNEPTGSHNYMLNQVAIRISEKNNKRKFNELIGQLKRLRVKADYEDCMMYINDSQNAINLSNEIVVILKPII